LIAVRLKIEAALIGLALAVGYLSAAAFLWRLMFG